jgi:hypothetical protein
MIRLKPDDRRSGGEIDFASGLCKVTLKGTACVSASGDFGIDGSVGITLNFKIIFDSKEYSITLGPYTVI